MHEKAVGLTCAERQGAQEVALLRRELGAGPCNGGAGGVVHIRIGAHHRRIVVAEHGNCACLDMRRNRIHGPAGIRAIADVITEKDMAIYAAGLRMREAGREGFPVGVNV